MWTSFWGSGIPAAKNYIALLQGVKITSKATSLLISGVKTEFDSRLPQDSENPSRVIAELQEYIWQVTPCANGGNGVDDSQPFNPRFYRPGVTMQAFH